MFSYGPPHMAEQKQDDQLEHTYRSYVRIRDVALKTCRKRWTIRRSDERGSGISVQVARHDDDDDDGLVSWTKLKKRMSRFAAGMLVAHKASRRKRERVTAKSFVRVRCHSLVVLPVAFFVPEGVFKTEDCKAKSRTLVVKFFCLGISKSRRDKYHGIFIWQSFYCFLDTFCRRG